MNYIIQDIITCIPHVDSTTISIALSITPSDTISDCWFICLLCSCCTCLIGLVKWWLNAGNDCARMRWSHITMYSSTYKKVFGVGRKVKGETYLLAELLPRYYHHISGLAIIRLRVRVPPLPCRNLEIGSSTWHDALAMCGISTLR